MDPNDLVRRVLGLPCGHSEAIPSTPPIPVACSLAAMHGGWHEDAGRRWTHDRAGGIVSFVPHTRSIAA